MAEGNWVAKRVAEINNGDTYARSQVARAIEDRFESDPALKAPGMPPLYGEFPIPHVMTLQGLVTTISRVYRVSDEALNDSVDNARFMEYDVGILECLEPRIRSSILLDWHIDPEDTNDPNQVFVCGELTKIVKAIERWQQVLENLTMAVWPGKYGVWFHYGWNQVGGHWRIMPYGDPSWLPVHGDKLVFRLMDGRLDHRQNQVGIRVGQTYRMDETISKGMGRGREGEYWRVEPTDRGLAYFLSVPEQNSMMIHKHKINDAAFERPQDAGRIHGYGIRSQLYWEWFMEKNTLQWLMEYIERSAFGLELWYYPLGNEKARLDAETAVKKRTGPFKNVLFVPVPAEESGTPNQFGVDHVETGAQGADILISLIKDFFGARRKRFILGQVLTTEAEATGLGGNLASIHLLSFRDIVKYDSKNRDDTVSAWINRTLKPWNFPGNGNWKCRYVTETEPVDADAKLNALKTCQDMGAPISQKDIYKAAGVTPPQPGDILATPMVQAMPGMGGPPGSSGPPPGGGPDAGPNASGGEPEFTETPEETDQFSIARYSDIESELESHRNRYPKAGPVVDGRQVLRHTPNMDSIPASIEHHEVLPHVREVPMSHFGGLSGKSYSVSETKRIHDLAGQIHKSKKIKPLIVAIDGHKDGPYILEGGHRAEALHKLGAKSFPARVVLDHQAIAENHKSSEKYSAYSDDLRERIARAAKETEKPTKRQRHAGNYKKGKVTIQGIPVVIENPKGSYRHYEFEGKKGKQELHHHYGYISGTEGTDDGQLDCFIGPDPESELVYIVNQIVPKTGKFDELKVLIGWYCEEEAREGYLSNYEKGWKGLGSLVRMTMPQFKEWLEKGDQRRSMVRQTAFYSEEDQIAQYSGEDFEAMKDASGKPRVFYHGTSGKPFQEFQGKHRLHEQLSFGIHFASEPHIAEHYATNPDVARKKTGGRVIPVHLHIKNPLDADRIVHEGSHEYELAKKLAGNNIHRISQTWHDPESQHHGKKALYLQTAIDSTHPKRASEIIQKAGYDGVRYRAKIIGQGVGGYHKTAEGESYLVFHPHQIRSAISPESHVHYSDSGDKSQHILSKMEESDPSKKGVLVGFNHLRKSVGSMGKEEFDSHILSLAKSGKISLHRHDYVAPLSEEEISELVHSSHHESGGTGNHPKGTYYVGAALRHEYSQEDGPVMFQGEWF